MNVLNNNTNMFSIFRQRFGQGSMMKSTREKLERQEKAQSQIDYWENQKENLKNMECDTVEEIAKKLEKFHSYEDAIAAAKQAYNFEQMRHVLDEAQEQGEKIAEAAEKTKPKTEEERKKEALEEVLEETTGTEETGDGMLEELMENVEELTEELTEEAAGELLESAEALEELTEGAAEELTEAFAGEAAEELAKETAEETLKDLSGEETARAARERAKSLEIARRYAGMASDREAERGVQYDYRM